MGRAFAAIRRQPLFHRRQQQHLLPSSKNLFDLHKSRFQQQQQESSSTFSVTLSSDTANPLWGYKTDTTVRARAIAYLEASDAFIIQDLADRDLLLVSSAMVPPNTPRNPLSDEDNGADFKYSVGERRIFYFDPSILDEEGRSLDGKHVSCIVDHRFCDGAGINWYVVRIPQYVDPSDEYNWWVAYDVRREDRI